VTDPVAAAVASLRDRDALSTAIERVTVGDRVVSVELTDGTNAPGDAARAGVAHRPAGDPPATDSLTLERLLRVVESPTESESADRLDRALGIAAVNALSAPFLDWRAGDPMALLETDVDRITTVGLFRPAFRKFDDVTVRVIERDPIADVPSRDGVRVETFTPEETAAAMADADVVFVTGSTFIYGGIDAYLDAAPADAAVVVLGATASFLPAPLFDRGVDVVAGASVSDPDAVRDAVTRGACGTDLHDAGLRKVYAAASQPAGLRLDSRDEHNPLNQ
jgi:uncharacterized protein (DUF4213/DUF364 family)